MPPTRILPALIALALAACGDGDTQSTVDTTTDTTADIADTTDTRPNDTGDASDTAGPPCNPILQSGCAADQNCTYVAAATTASCVESGPVPANGPCSVENRCRTGVCMSLNATDNFCYQVCDKDTDCGAGTANLCLTLNGAPFKVCKIPGIYDECDLLAQNCADEDKACYAVAGEPEPICLTEGTGAPGSECDTAAACTKGHACVSQVCRPICDPDVAGSCGENATCRDLFDDAGYCAPN